MEKNCKNCGKFPFCKEAEKENCEEWKRKPYMYLKSRDGYKWEFERID